MFPLLTTSSGAKFGKSEAGTVWLDSERTSPFAFYQYWLNAEDDDVVRYLRYFTLLTRDEIQDLAREVESRPGERAAQRRLAAEVTRTVHGSDQLARAEQASTVLFGGSLEGLSAAEIEEIFRDVPSSTVDRGRLDGDGEELVGLMVEVGACPSKGEARRLIQGGGVYLNAERVEDVTAGVTSQHAIEGRYVVLRVGKKRYHLVELR